MERMKRTKAMPMMLPVITTARMTRLMVRSGLIDYAIYLAPTMPDNEVL